MRLLNDDRDAYLWTLEPATRSGARHQRPCPAPHRSPLAEPTPGRKGRPRWLIWCGRCSRVGQRPATSTRPGGPQRSASRIHARAPAVGARLGPRRGRPLAADRFPPVGQRGAPGHLAPDDLPRASDLLRQALVHDRLTPAGVRHLLFDDPGFDPALTRTAEDGGRLVGIAVGAAPDEQLQAPGGIKLFAVAPSHRRRGIATASWTRWKGRCGPGAWPPAWPSTAARTAWPWAWTSATRRRSASSGSGATSAPAPPRTWWSTSPPRTRLTCRPARTRRACWRAGWPSGGRPPPTACGWKKE